MVIENDKIDYKAEIYNRQIERFRKLSLSFDKLIKDREFKLYLGSLGLYTGDPETIFGTNYLENKIKISYWTKTRWRIERFKNKHYILSPAFYDDEELQARFAIRFEKEKLEIRVYVETPMEKKILDKIGCYKILIDYSLDGEKLESSKIHLSPWDELSVTISNLDAFFWEQVPIYESFDLNIIHQAFNILIDKKLAPSSLLIARCNEILEIIEELIKDEEMYEPQIYIQIKALIDYTDIECGDWFEKLFKKINLIDYLYKIYHGEDEEVKLKIGYLIETKLNEKILYSLLRGFDVDNLNMKKRIFWFFGVIRSRKILLFFERSLDSEDKELMDKIIAILLEIGSIDGYLLLINRFSNLKLDFKTRILNRINSSLSKIHQIYDQLTPEGIYQFESITYSLLELLKKEKELDIRIKLIETLGNVGFKKIGPLIEILGDPNSKIRAAVVEALGRIKDNEAFRPLILQLNDESQEVQMKVIDALGELGDSLATVPLIKKLKNKDSNVIRATINSLGKLRDERAIEHLIPFLNHPDSKIRLRTLDALGEINDPSPCLDVVKKLQDEHPDVRAKAAEILGLLGDVRAADQLLDKLNDIDQVKIESIRALGSLREKKAVDRLIDLLKSEPLDVKKEILITLGKIREKDAINPILEQLNERGLRGTIIWALSEIEDEMEIKYLIKKLQRTDLKSKMQVIDELSKIDSEKTIPPLIICMNDENKKVASRAKKLLEEKIDFNSNFKIVNKNL